MPSSEYREGVAKTSSMFLNRAEMKTRKVKAVKREGLHFRGQVERVYQMQGNASVRSPSELDRGSIQMNTKFIKLNRLITTPKIKSTTTSSSAAAAGIVMFLKSRRYQNPRKGRSSKTSRLILLV